MRLSEKTPIMAFLILTLAVGVGLALWYADVRQQAQTQQALEQTRDAFERYEREHKVAPDTSVASGLTPAPAPSGTAAAGSPAGDASHSAQRDSAPASAASAAHDSREIYFLLAALLVTALIALAVAALSYRTVHRERRLRMEEEERYARAAAAERGPIFRPAEDVTIIDAEDVETVVTEPAPGPHAPPAQHADSKEQLQTWAEQAPLAAVMLEPSGEVIAVNGAFRRMTGYARKDVPNLQAWLTRALRVAPDAVYAARDAFRERYAQRDESAYELTVWTRDGEPRQWLAHAAVIPLEDGETVWLLMASDITDRRNAEHAALERAEAARNEAAELAALYDHMPTGFAVLDAQLRFRRVNRRMAELTGLSAAEHAGKPLRKLLPNVAAGVEPLLEQALKGSPASAPSVAVRTPASPKADRYWHVACAPVKDAAGRVTQLDFLVEDVSERHQTDAAARESENTLRAILEHLPAPVCVKDLQGRYLYSNPAYDAFIHVAPGQLKGKLDHEVLAWEAADRLREADEDALAADAVVESRGAAKLGNRTVHFVASKTALREHGSRPHAVCGVYVDCTAQVEAESEIKAAEERYRSIFDVSPQPMLVDRDNKLAYVNAACVRLLGARDAQQLLGRSILEFIQQPWHKVFQERVQRALRRKPVEGKPLEAKLLRLDGNVIDAEIEASLYETPHERAVQILVRDVTERKQSDEALRAAEARLRSIVEETPAMVRIADADGNATFWSAQWQRCTGMSQERALGTRWLDHVHADDRGRVSQALSTARTQRDPVHCEYRLRERNGAWRWVHDLAAPHFDDAGAHLGHIACVTDITERKQLEETLQRDAGRYRILSELGSVPLWISRGDRCDYANPALRHFFGASGGGDEGFDWLARIHPDDRETHARHSAAAEGEAVGRRYGVRAQRADGEYRTLSITLAPERTPEGCTGRWIGSFEDVTDVKRIEQALRETDKRRNAFLSALAADLRTPLAPLRNAADVLRVVPPEDPRARQAADIVARQGQYLARRLEDAIDVSRHLDTAPVLDRKVSEIGALVHRAVAASRPLIEARELVMNIALAAGRVQVRADEGRMVQAITALLDYAARNAAAGSELALRLEEEGERVALHVRAGIVPGDESALAALFELFSDADAGPQSGGIALPLVRQLATLHGGAVEARHAEHGIDFVLSLPVHVERAQTGTAGANAGANGHRRVLVIDRDPDAAASLMLLLQLQGHDVRIARDRAAAVLAAQEFHPDTVLMETDGDADGEDHLARKLRLLPETAHAALLGMTVRADAVATSSDAVYDHYLLKPVEPQLLEHVLARTSPTLH